MDLPLLLLILVSLIFLIYFCILVIFSKNNKYALEIAILSLGLSGWALTNALYRIDINLFRLFIWSHLAYDFALISIYSFCFFTIKFSKPIRHIKVIKIILISLLCVFIVSQFIPDFVIKEITLATATQSKSIVTGNGIYLFAFTLIVTATLSFARLINVFKFTVGIERKQLSIIFLGAFFTSFFSIITNLFLPILKIYDIVWSGPVFSFILLYALTYAILKHRFLSITTIINSILSIFLNNILLQILFYGLAYIYLFMFGTLFAPTVYIIGFFIGLPVAFIIKKAFEKSNSFKFFTKKYDPQTFLQNIRTNSYLKMTTSEVIADFISTSRKYLGIQQIDLINISSFSNEYVEFITNITQYTNETKKKLIFIQEDNTLLQYLNNEDEYSVILCIYRDNKIVYILLFHSRDNYSAYDIEDINALNEATERLNLAINRNLLTDEQKQFNEILQKKLDAATAELQQQKAAVEDQYRTERDMVGIMGHELRTPLTSARGFLEIAVTKAKNDPEMPVKNIQHYLDNVFEAFKREIDLVQTMLSTSHVDNNKLKLDLIEVDLDGVIQGAVMDFTPEAEKKNLKLEYHPIENLPHIKSDPSRTIEVINNLVSNAIKYTPAGRVDILLTYDDQFVYYSVKDTGDGIPESEIPNIGKKFYRVQNYIEGSNKESADKSIVRPGGTGLGMYIVKAILEAAGGELRIESKVGVGSTFTAVFPRWNG